MSLLTNEQLSLSKLETTNFTNRGCGIITVMQ
jgi:hypothetical protein